LSSAVCEAAEAGRRAAVLGGSTQLPRQASTKPSPPIAWIAN